MIGNARICYSFGITFPSIDDVLGVSLTAAHNAVELAGESPVVGIDCLPT